MPESWTSNVGALGKCGSRVFGEVVCCVLVERENNHFSILEVPEFGELII